MMLISLVWRADAAQQAPVLTVASLQLAVDRLMDDRRYPAVPGGLPGQANDSALLQTALASPYADLRAAAVRAEGRFESADEVPTLLRYFRDTDSKVRIEAGNAVALSLRHAQPADALPALQALVSAIGGGVLPGYAPGRRGAGPPVFPGRSFTEEWVYDTLGRLPYATPDADRVERILADAVRARLEGDPAAEIGLTNLIASDPSRRVAPATHVLLETRARAAHLDAWRALQVLGDADPALIAFGATYGCGPPECGAAVREIAVSMINPRDASLAPVLAQARHDYFPDVRLVALRQLAKLVPETKDCSFLVDAMTDSNEPTATHLEALSFLDAHCEHSDEIAAHLLALASLLGDPNRQDKWHEPARALEVLARFDDEATRRLIVEAASGHSQWQARAAAVRAAATLKDDALVRVFAADPEPNVRTEVVNALAALASPETTKVAMSGLESPDYQLVAASVAALKQRTPEEVEVKPIVAALHRLTAQGKDTSHAPRKALLEWLKSLAAMTSAGGDPSARQAIEDEVAPLLHDWDPEIASLASDVIGSAIGVRPDPHPTYRRPEQPTEAEIAPQDLPDKATIELDTLDRFDVRFLKTEAPIAIARFAKLARRGYYTGSAFYRVVPLMTVRGGSPGANEYMGTDRYLRDEIGLEHHTAGTLGLVTSGRDTGNGQFFIDLTDQHQLDYVYTAFARVVPDRLQPDVVQRILEGARIANITLSK
jgi:cyclophilin family peptidyl-prolyl cis-trans isomerase/HEAT repeat protein